MIDRTFEIAMAREIAWMHRAHVTHPAGCCSPVDVLYRVRVTVYGSRGQPVMYADDPGLLREKRPSVR